MSPGLVAALGDRIGNHSITPFARAFSERALCRGFFSAIEQGLPTTPFLPDGQAVFLKHPFRVLNATRIGRAFRRRTTPANERLRPRLLFGAMGPAFTGAQGRS